MSKKSDQSPDVAPEGEALFPSDGIEKKAEVARKPTKAPILSPTTPEGDNAGAIIKAWIDWYTECDGVPIPQATISRMGKHVQALIQSGYTSADIKFGLAIWTMKKLEDPPLSPARVDDYVWEWASSTRGKGRAWRSLVMEQIKAFGSTSAASTRPKSRQERQDENLAGMVAWAERKQQNGA